MDRIAPFHLKTLIAIARMGTFQAAADRLGTTQPAISARIRELEAQLGIKLFYRDGRRMSLTPRARQLVRESEPVLAELDQMLMRAAKESFAAGTVRIGTGEIASASCLPGFIQTVQQAFPLVTLEIEVDLTARMLEHLLAGRSDLVFLAGPVLHPGIRTTSVGSLDLVWLAGRETAAGVSATVPHAIWALPPHSPIHRVVHEAIRDGEVACSSLNSCNNVRTMIDIVAQGGGIGLFPETMVRHELAGGRLVEVLRRPPNRIEFQAAIRNREMDALILQLFELTAVLDIDPRHPPASTP
jgi:DNA-binding transcriptional LysR family regulator